MYLFSAERSSGKHENVVLTFVLFLLQFSWPPAKRKLWLVDFIAEPFDLLERNEILFHDVYLAGS